MLSWPMVCSLRKRLVSWSSVIVVTIPLDNTLGIQLMIIIRNIYNPPEEDTAIPLTAFYPVFIAVETLSEYFLIPLPVTITIVLLLNMIRTQWLSWFEIYNHNSWSFSKLETATGLYKLQSLARSPSPENAANSFPAIVIIVPLVNTILIWSLHKSAMYIGPVFDDI